MDNDSGSDHDNAVEETFTKGAWSQEENNLLLAYIEKHGDGNITWNDIAKNSTLSRSGRSCRHRWLNHLRPNLKKGAFTDEEEQRVVELQAEMGNKWSKIAAQLPGRTDNEIKNFWRTRRRRLQRQSGLNPDPFVESTLEHVHVLDNATQYPPFEPLIHSTEKFELPSFQVFDSHEETRNLEAQQCELISDNALVQPPLTDQTPSIDYESSLYDGLLESVAYRSSGERRATETEPGSPLHITPILGHSDQLPPSTLNTTGQNFNFGSTSSEEKPFDGDWIRHLLGEDRNNTK